MRTDALLLFLAGAAFFLPAVASRDVWQPLETRYATIAREMAETGDWLLPRINGEPYQDKPPLFFWLGAVLWKVAGPQCVRVVSALAGAGTLVVLAALARLWFSRRAALLSAAILATTPEFGWLARFGELDVALTFFTTLSVYGWFAGGKRTALFYLGMGLAVMVKGPPGVLVPVVAAVAGRLARVPPSSPRAPRHPLWGPVVVILPVACWLVPAFLKAGLGYAHELIIHHMFGRVVDSWQHKQPFYFYVNEALWNFFPWLPLAVPAGIRAWRRRRDEPASAMLLLWFLIGLLAFSAVSGKRIAYILPLVPAFALLVGRGVEALLVEAERAERRTATAHVVMHGVLAAMGIGLLAFGLFGTRFHKESKDYVAEALAPIMRLPGGAPLAAGGLLLVVLGILGARLAVRGRHAAGLWTLAGAMVVGFFAVDFTFVPRANGYKSPRTVAEAMDRRVPAGAGEVGIYPALPQSVRGAQQYAYSGAFNAYSKRLRFVPLADGKEVAGFLAGPGPRLVVTSRSWVEKGLKNLPAGVEVAEAGRVDREEMVFLLNSR
ncbi:MAG TPA: phospholipid carrier-dependent glycosyltransferase [Planctomycetota bacterium]|nr:phospholipid carrier-dependent glycosyltransferase [Planctomycetota bacterium]